MKTEYRLCVTRGTSKRPMRYGKRDRNHAETDAAKYATPLERGLAERVWIESRQVSEWKEGNNDDG